MSNVKILACGDVKGRIADLMKRLVSILVLPKNLAPKSK